MTRSKIARGFFRALLARLSGLALALHILAMAPGAHAQGTRKDDIVFNTRGVPLAGATVRVCVMPASGQPCTPLAQIFSDPALTQALANPTTTDGMGNYSFYAAPGKYELEFSGPGITTKQLPNVILPSDPTSPSFSSVSSTGGISAFSLSLTGNLTVNGNTAVVGNLAGPSINNLIFVDGNRYAQTDAGIQAALNAAGAGTVVLGPGTYTLSNPITMTTSGQHLLCAGIGSTKLNYTGSTAIAAVLDIGTKSDGTNNLENISVNGCTISGNANVTDVIRTRGVHRSDFSHNSLINATEAGIHANFGVGLDLDDLHTSSNEQAFTQQPASCIILDGPDTSHETTIASIKLPVCEGVSGTGIVGANCATPHILRGTSEGNNKGISISANCQGATVDGTDMEANATSDAEISGSFAELRNVISGKLTHIFSGAVGVKLSGGNYNSITIDSGAKNTQLAGLNYNNSGSGSISDSGTNTSKIQVFNANGSPLDANIFPTGLILPLSTKSSAYTLTSNDRWVNVTGTTTITVPHAVVGQSWIVFNSGSATVTVQADSGNINGASNITLAANIGKEITCDGTNCFAH